MGGSALNHLVGEVTSVTEFGNRARVGVAASQPLVAEVTSASIAPARARAGVPGGGELEGDGNATHVPLKRSDRGRC